MVPKNERARADGQESPSYKFALEQVRLQYLGTLTSITCDHWSIPPAMLIAWS